MIRRADTEKVILMPLITITNYQMASSKQEWARGYVLLITHVV
jgi:hypothetical protein